MGLTALWLTTLAGITIVKRSRELARKSQSLIESEERLRLAMEGAGMGTGTVTCGRISPSGRIPISECLAMFRRCTATPRLICGSQYCIPTIWIAY